MACVVSAVSIDCPSGPSLIIRDHVDGIMVPPEDVDIFTEAVVALLNDEKTRLELASMASRVIDRYAIGEICSEWEYLYRTTLYEICML